MSKISCVIHTYNSEPFLEECLKSIYWCDEIVVIDMMSTDRTKEICIKYNVRFFEHENLGYADPARRFGQDKCQYDWILSVDSDEIISDGLAKKLQFYAKNNLADVFYLSFRNYFFGRELKGTGWSYKDIYVPRFYKKGFLNYGDQVHNFISISKNARVLKLIDYDLSIIHFNYNSVEHFISKLNRYTNFEANKEIYDGNPWIKMIYHFNRELLGRLIIKKGYLDGWVGLYLSLAMAFYKCTSIAKRKLPTEKDAILTYKKLAAEVKVASKKNNNH